MDQGRVYVARCQDLYKIGYTARDPQLRMADLQTGNPFPVELMGSIPGTRDTEAGLHAVFASRKVQGEWYALTPEDVSDILGEEEYPESFLRFMMLTKKLSPRQKSALAREASKIFGK